VDTQNETAVFFEPANFGQAVNVTTGLVRTIVKIEPFDCCSAVTNGAEVDGNIALVVRGTCLFTDKVANAMEAGAAAVVVVNTADELFRMSGDGVLSVLVPSILVTSSTGATIEQVPRLHNHRRYTTAAAQTPSSPS
jgi:hypothetical protein